MKSTTKKAATCSPLQTALKRPARPYTDLSSREKVQRAIPLAQEILIGHGIDCDPTPGHEQIIDRLAVLMGDYFIDAEKLTEDEYSQICNGLEAAQVLGIALGLLLRPEAFGIGGTR